MRQSGIQLFNQEVSKGTHEESIVKKNDLKGISHMKAIMLKVSTVKEKNRKGSFFERNQYSGNNVKGFNYRSNLFERSQLLWK